MCSIRDDVIIMFGDGSKRRILVSFTPADAWVCALGMHMGTCARAFAYLPLSSHVFMA